MKNLILILISLLTSLSLYSQSNFKISNPTAEDVLKGNYDPNDFLPSTDPIFDPHQIIASFDANVNPSRLLADVQRLELFGTRNTGSDTLSTTTGIGAARNWLLDEFKSTAAENEDRLLPFFFQFDQNVCGMGRHKNTCAILPGSQVDDKSIIIVEAHMDSRCESTCDITCPAPGSEDNSSGTALVLELARLMSPYVYDHTIVFIETTGEEQGLVGANAFAQYCVQQNIPIKAVFNNDVIGGVICGETSSPPSCPFEGAIDSTQVRLFSFVGESRQLSRWIKMEYMQELEPIVKVPMMLSIMGQEDRVGRGGDHIPFRELGFAAMRFTSANENGSANVSDPDYDDHQHTTEDVLGFDTDGDGILDSLFVDFNYLSRNTVINATAIAAAAVGPPSPQFSFTDETTEIYWEVDDPLDLGHYIIATRSASEDFDTIYSFEGVSSGRIPRLVANPSFQRVSGASVDEDLIESFFSPESSFFTISSTEQVNLDKRTNYLMQNISNPFSYSTLIQYKLGNIFGIDKVDIVIHNTLGQEIDRLEALKNLGINSFSYYPNSNMEGSYYYSLVINNHIVDTKLMVLLN